MNLSYREDYWDSPELKEQFLSFLIQIHGLDLSRWDKMGFWDRKYRPFSYFDGDSLISNVCIYSMDMTIQGQRRLVAQVSAVGTLPEYRRKGLNIELTQKAMDWARVNHDFLCQRGRCRRWHYSILSLGPFRRIYWLFSIHAT